MSHTSLSAQSADLYIPGVRYSDTESVLLDVYNTKQELKFNLIAVNSKYTTQAALGDVNKC